ncbi:MAG: zinc ribbon domain-containing protein [Anaerolineae bacterium]|nr:zinc ribbon domain-containing protein [Anaerolineae bacterium]MCI0609038.1 zinc ribbon domain-containing protein [Anaerolineae bacterium]
MPVYVYRCGSCGVQFERHQFFHDAPLKICPECRKKTLKKVITPTKVIFKGSGFYSTDHKSASGNNSSSAGKSGDGKSEKKEESKPSEAKSSETKSSEKSE